MRFLVAALVIAAVFGLLFTKSFGPGHTVHKQTDRKETRQIANSVSARSLGSALRAIPSPSKQAPAAVPFSVRTPAHVAVYTDAEYGYTIATPPEVMLIKHSDTTPVGGPGNWRRWAYRDMDITAQAAATFPCMFGLTTANLQSAINDWISEITFHNGLSKGLDIGNNSFVGRAVEPPNMLNNWEQTGWIKITYAGDCVLNSLWFRFPANKESEYSSFISELTLSFRPGPLNQLPHPIALPNDALRTFEQYKGIKPTQPAR